MILADKIINERKKNGWSQEELAEKLGVSRQSVSKWEGAQSVPDMQRILEMSRIFGVSCDYLLKEELEPEESVRLAEVGNDATCRSVSMEEAQTYLYLRHRMAPLVALGVFLCIFGAAALVLMAGVGESGVLPGLGEDGAGALGLMILLGCVAGAVTLFIRSGRMMEDFAFLEKEPFETAYGVDGMVRERKAEYREKYGSYPAIATTLCITSLVPLLLTQIFDMREGVMPMILSVCLLLLMVGAAVVLFILSGMHTGGVQVLLQEGDYSREEKRRSGVTGTVAGAFWLFATAVYLGWSFWSGAWDRTWIVWPVAGVLFPMLMGLIRLLSYRRE